MRRRRPRGELGGRASSSTPAAHTRLNTLAIPSFRSSAKFRICWAGLCLGVPVFEYYRGLKN